MARRTCALRPHALLEKLRTLIFVACLIVLFLLSQLPDAVSAASGDLDATFGNRGIVTTDFFGADDEAAAAAIQASQQIRSPAILVVCPGRDQHINNLRSTGIHSCSDKTWQS